MSRDDFFWYLIKFVMALPDSPFVHWLEFKYRLDLFNFLTYWSPRSSSTKYGHPASTVWDPGAKNKSMLF